MIGSLSWHNYLKHKRPFKSFLTNVGEYHIQTCAEKNLSEYHSVLLFSLIR